MSYSLCEQVCPIVSTEDIMFEFALYIPIEEIIPNIEKSVTIAKFECLPPSHLATRMCTIMKIDTEEYLVIWDMNTKTPIEVRTTKKVIWRFDWIKA